MTTTIRALAPDQTTSEETLAEIANLLSRSDRRPSVSDGKGRQVAPPAEVVDAFRQVIAALQSRQPTVLYPKLALLTTQQAADLLGVSRPYLIRLLEEGKIPYSKSGSHRRILYEDLMAFSKVQDAGRSQALNEFLRSSEEFGLYDFDDQLPSRLTNS